MDENVVDKYKALRAQVVTGKLSELLPSLIVFAHDLGEADLEMWARLETEGYVQSNPAYHEGAQIPPHRYVNGEYRDSAGSLVHFNSNQLALWNGVSEIEHWTTVNGEIRIKGKWLAASTFTFSFSSAVSVLGAIRVRVIDKLQSIGRVISQTKTSSAGQRSDGEMAGSRRVLITKVSALGVQVKTWLGKGAYNYDPSAVNDLFHRYSTLRDYLRRTLPDHLGDLPIRTLPMVAESSDFDGRGYVTRSQLELLANDISYVYHILSGLDEVTREPVAVTNEAIRTSSDRTQVFIIHGRNEAIRKSLFDFLRAIGLKPLEWAELLRMTDNPSPYIGEVLDQAFERAQAAVALLTPDDLAHLRPDLQLPTDNAYERQPTGQARPNVLFETGMAFGRFPKRTVLVEVGDLRPFSDVAGRHTVKLNDSATARKTLADRLAICGCQVNLSGTDWLTVGRLEL